LKSWDGKHWPGKLLPGFFKCPRGPPPSRVLKKGGEPAKKERARGGKVLKRAGPGRWKKLGVPWGENSNPGRGTLKNLIKNWFGAWTRAGGAVREGGKNG